VRCSVLAECPKLSQKFTGIDEVWRGKIMKEISSQQTLKFSRKQSLLKKELGEAGVEEYESLG